MLKFPDITLGLPLRSRIKEDKYYAFLYFSNLILVTVILITVILDSFHFFESTYYPIEMSVLGIGISSLYFLIRGSKKIAINLINFLPIPIYFSMVSPVTAIITPQSSFFLHTFILSLGMVFLVIFSEKLKSILFFILVSFSSFVYHVYTAGAINKLFKPFWTSDQVLINPFLIVIFSSIAAVLIFELFHRKVLEKEEKIEKIKASHVNFLYQIPFGIISLRIERDEFGEKSGLRIEQINPTFETFFGIRNGEVKGKKATSVFEILFKNEINCQDIFLNAIKNLHEVYLSESGQWYRIAVIHPDKDQITGIFENITETKDAIKELDNSRYRYKLLLETIPDIFFVIDKEGTYIDYVSKEEEGFKFSPEEIIGSTIFEVGYSEKMVKQVYKSIQTVINLDAIETIEYALEIAGRGSCFFEMRMVKLSDMAVMAISRDITKQKIAQQRIEEARKKAEEADQLKSAFLQNISHEVRTPLNAIVGFSNVLLEDDEIIENERTSYLQLIIRNSQILLHVFNDTIKLSRLQSGQMAVEKKLTRINQTMLDLYRQFLMEKDLLGKNHLKLNLIKGNENVNFSVYLDNQKVKDILESLLNNAVKFTKEGEINFGYRINDGGKFEFFVSDTGIGIPEDKFEDIFQRFYQLDSSMTREYGGTGIGLSLANDFAKLLGSKVEVQSSLGKGSVFSFTIQAEAVAGHLKIV